MKGQSLPVVRTAVKYAKIRREVVRLVLMYRLDRRKVYSVVDGLLATEERFTGECSGCKCDCGDGHGCSHKASGCQECGYTGKRVTVFASPVMRKNGETVRLFAKRRSKA